MRLFNLVKKIEKYIFLYYKNQLKNNSNFRYLRKVIDCS